MNHGLPFLVSLQLAACSGSEEVDPYAMLAHHDGYWVTEVDSAELPVTVINDLHVDVETRRPHPRRPNTPSEFPLSTGGYP